MQAFMSIPLTDLVLALSSVSDMISPAVANHQKRVAYLSFRLGQQLGLPETELRDVVIAAALHDIGVFTAEEREELLDFIVAPAQRHSEIGYALLSRFAPFAKAAELIRYHHTHWSESLEGSAATVVPRGSHIIHLADRIDVLLSSPEFVLNRLPQALLVAQQHSGSIFAPDIVAALHRLARLEYIWLDMRSPLIDDAVRRAVDLGVLDLDYRQLLQLAETLSHLVDFKSSYTSAHTAGVAAAASELAKLAGFTKDECQMMQVAAYLHDLGKLAVSAEILDQPDKLTEIQFSVMRSHTYHTRRILEAIPGLAGVANWAASHHERSDGEGYPYHATELSPGAQVVAVADVYIAISENRPYRAGMPESEVKAILETMASQGKLDQKLVELLVANYPQFEELRRAAQSQASCVYGELTDLLAVN